MTPDSQDHPLVSILTPSFNQAAWLGDNLRSVASQTYPNVEHIVMDGASTDGSVAILEAASDSVRWRSEPDKGQSDAINKAFLESSGEIIGWINSDDAYFDLRVVEDVVAYFLANPGIDVVYGHCAQVTGEGALIQVLWAPPFSRDLLRAVDIISQPTAFIRRSALAAPMLDETYHFAMDYELWLRLDAGNHRFAQIDRFIAIDRHYSTRKSATIVDVMDADLARLSHTYTTHFGADWQPKRSAFYRRQRLMGALLIPRIHRSELAFTASADFKSGLWRRQILSRRSHWPRRVPLRRACTPRRSRLSLRSNRESRGAELSS